MIIAMNIFNKDIKLVIFDLDGTLIDSTDLWGDVDRKFFERRNSTIPESYAKEIAHIGLKAAAKHTKEKYFPNEEVKDILKEWEELSLEAYETYIPLKPHARELLEYLFQNDIKIALATANSDFLYRPCLKRLNIEKYFSFIIDVNSCNKGKDSSEIFDKAREHFSFSREETIVFEDSLQAIKTAFKAGYKVVSVYDKHSTKNIDATRENSHLLIKDFKEFLNFLK